MAILEDLGLEVKIIVNDSPLQEYEDKEVGPTDDGFGDETRKCRRYVEVVEDAEFSAQFRVTSAHHLNNSDERFRFALDLDGQEDLAGVLLRSGNNQFLVKGKKEYHGQTSVLRKFRFTTVATVDDDNAERVAEDKKAVGHLGLIRVRVWRCKVGEKIEPSTEVSESSMPSTPSTTTRFDEIETQLAEKAVKGTALSHRATLSAAVPTEDFSVWNFEYVDPFNVPLATFYFKYRSKAALQAELIIPRSRHASPQLIAIEDMSLQQIRQLASESLDNMPLGELRRLAQLQSSRIKEGSIAPTRPSVKREQVGAQTSGRPQKVVKISGGREAIDLTDDD